MSREPPDRASDLELASRACAGDIGAQRMLAERVLDPVRRAAAYLEGSRDRADDLSQLALVQILRSVGTYEGGATLERWAHKVTVRTYIAQARKRKRRKRLREENPTELGGSEPAEDAVSSLRLRRALALLMETISPQKKVAIILHHILGYTVSEIADLTGSPAYTVRDRLKKGRRQLRNSIEANPSLRVLVKEVM